MKILKNVKLLIVFALLIIFCDTNICLAITKRHLYIYPAKQADIISNLINKHITDKKYYIYKSNISGGFFCFQLKYLWMYTDGDYVAANLKQVDSDVYLYIQNNYNSELYREKLLKYLNKNGYRYLEIKDKDLIKKFEQDTSGLIASQPNSTFYLKTSKDSIDNQPVLATNTIKENTVVQPSDKTVPAIQQQVLPVQKDVVKTESTAPAVKLRPAKIEQSVNIPTPQKIQVQNTAENLQETPANYVSPYREMSKAGTIFSEVNKGVVTIISAGHGSGFLVDDTGLIVTNNHVVQDQGDTLRVRFGKGEIVEGKVLEKDPQNDIAIVWVNLQNIKDYSVLNIFNPHDQEPLVMVGEKVIAIGSPVQWETCEKTLTQGVVGKYENQIIMHDANINHGNSGGPLINFGGYVVGINTFVYTTEDKSGLSGSIAITNAIPLINKAKVKIQNMQRPFSDLLPDIPQTPYSYNIMKSAYYSNDAKSKIINKRTNPYIISTPYYNIAIITPPQKFRKLANEEEQYLKRHKKRLNKAGEQISSDEYLTKNLASWEYNKPAVTVLILPRPQITNGSLFMSALSIVVSGLTSSSGNYHSRPIVKYSYEFKKDFDKLYLINGRLNKAYQPYTAGKVPITKKDIEILNIGNANLIDKSYLGYYEFDSNLFNTTDSLNFRLISQGNETPITITIPDKFKRYIIEDFKPYWDYIGSKH